MPELMALEIGDSRWTSFVRTSPDAVPFHRPEWAQLLADWHDAHFQHSHFDQNRALALIEEVLKDGARQGFSLTRSVGHGGMGAGRERPGVEDFVEYEARLNYMLAPVQRPSHMSI